MINTFITITISRTIAVASYTFWITMTCIEWTILPGPCSFTFTGSCHIYNCMRYTELTIIFSFTTASITELMAGTFICITLFTSIKVIANTWTSIVKMRIIYTVITIWLFWSMTFNLTFAFSTARSIIIFATITYPESFTLALTITPKSGMRGAI